MVYSSAGRHVTALLSVLGACTPQAHVVDGASPAADAASPPDSSTPPVDAGPRDAGSRLDAMAIDVGIPPLPPGDRSLHAVAAYGVPEPDARGIACDGEHVWLSVGLDGEPTHSIVHLHLATGEIDRRFTFPSDTDPPPGTLVQGLAFDGATLYLALSGSSHRIVVIDASTGAVLRQFLSPTELGPIDLEIADDLLYVAGGVGTIHRVQHRTGAVLSAFMLPAPERDYGIATIDGETIIGNLLDEMLWVYDRETGTQLGTITDIDGSPIEYGRIGTMCAEGSRLRILSEWGIQEYEVR